MKELKDNVELNKYLKELDSDLALTKFNIREKSLMISSYRAKWLSYYYAEKENLSRINAAKQKVLKQKVGESKNIDSVLRMKSEDKLAESDATVQKLDVLKKVTQDNIDFLERALNAVDSFAWDIKNVIEVCKLEFK